MQDALFNIYAILFNRNVVQIYWMTGVIWVKLNGFKALSCPVCVSWVDVQVPCSSRSSGLTDACALCREARFWWWRMDRARPQSSACRPSPRNSRRRYRRWDFPQTLLLHMGTEISDLCFDVTLPNSITVIQKYIRQRLSFIVLWYICMSSSFISMCLLRAHVSKQWKRAEPVLCLRC